MRKVAWIAGGLLGIVVLLIVGGISYLKFALPDTGLPEDLKIESTPERLKRGEYLALHVAACIDCHSSRDFNLYSGPIVKGTEGQGGEAFTEDLGFPGKIYAKNISPAGIGHWTDGEVWRAVTTGVSKEGNALFPLMPYLRYGASDREDISSIIAYVRTLRPIENKIKETSLNFPMNLIVRTIPKKAVFQKRPDNSDTVAYGRYLANMASCVDCHTKAEKGKQLPGMEFAGGFEFRFPTGTVRSANITPEETTGIGAWDRARFVNKFKSFAADAASHIPITEPYDETRYNTVMPWTMYAGMTEEDLGAIYAYLRTIKPVTNKVSRFSAY